MRDYNIQFNNSGDAVFTGDVGLEGELNATRLLITPSGDMASANIDSYSLCFDSSAGLENPVKICRRSEIIDGEGENYFEDGVIYYILPGELTSRRKLGVQLEAHFLNEDGTLGTLMKAKPFTLTFGESLEGDEVFFEESGESIMARIYGAIADAAAAAEAVSQSADEGDFDGTDATINGVNALTLTASNGVLLTQSGSTATLTADIDGTVPLVTALPDTADDGEMCLHKSANTYTALSSIPSGTNEVYINPDFGAAESDDYFNVQFFNGENLVFEIGGYSHPNTTLNNGSGCEIYYISYSGGDMQTTLIDWTQGNAPQILLPDADAAVSSPIPEKITLPEFTSVTVNVGSLANQDLIRIEPYYTYTLYRREGFVWHKLDYSELDGAPALDFVSTPATADVVGSVPMKGASGVVWSPNCSKASQAVTADTSIELPAYKMTTLDTSTASANLTVTLSFAAVSEGMIDEFNLRLILGSTYTTTLVFPNTVSWLGSEPTFENGKTYDISIVGGIAAWGAVAE